MRSIALAAAFASTALATSARAGSETVLSFSYDSLLGQYDA
jgi:hypothetical protein